MAENLTIDSSSLVKSSNMFSESMVAFLDTEMEYIQYLRERNGGGAGVGGVGWDLLPPPNILVISPPHIIILL